MINLRAEIVAGEDLVKKGLSRTVCRILSLYNLTPLLQKLRETEGGERQNGRKSDTRKEGRDVDRKTKRKRDR
jgi:hypothetical protein